VGSAGRGVGRSTSAGLGRCRRARRWTCGVLLGAALAAGPSAARAYDFVLTSRTIGQGYAERRYGAGGSAELLTRRRLTQYLNLSVFNIEPDHWHGPDADRNLLSFEVAMRFDGDFGTYLTRRPSGPDTIGELQQSQVDILYAYLLARDVGGHLDVQLGRQLHYDLVDFYSFDGVDAQAHVGHFVTAQAFAGTEVRGDMPLSAPIYEIDGTSSGSRDPATRPEQSSAWRPMVGAALALGDALRSLPADVRMAYRKTFSDTVDPRPGDPGSGVNHESVSMTADARFRDRVFLSAGARYNLLVAAWDDQQASLRFRLGARHALSAEYSYLAPTFDGDSIWNIFAAGAYRDFRASYDVELSSLWRAHVRGFYRLFIDPPGTPAALSDAMPGGHDAYGGNAGVELRTVRGRARAEAYAEAGAGGWKVGGDVSARWNIRPNLFDLEGRLTATSWRSDDVPQPQDAFMVGGGLGCVYHLGRKMRVHFLGEDNSGTYYRAQVRGLAILEMDVTL